MEEEEMGRGSGKVKEIGVKQKCPRPTCALPEEQREKKEVFSGDTAVEESHSEEPPVKIVRHETDGKGFHGQQKDGRKDSGRATLFIRCPAIHSRGELVNGFLCEHREALGIQEWYVVASDASTAGVTDTLRPDAPIESVFVKNSRKPYFLLEYTGKADDASEVVNKLMALHMTRYGDHVVHVEMAKGGLSVAAERKKLEQRDAAKRGSAKFITSGEPKRLEPFTVTAFVPRVLQR